MTAQVLLGDCRELLPTLPAESVHCVITSPPYWGLRDYKCAGQIGLEETLDEYLATIVQVFRAVQRVLRRDGTLWLNMGDCYAPDARWGGRSGHKNVSTVQGGSDRTRRRSGLKFKDLVGLPWRVAFALQADGWYLRSDIVWHKSTALPESVEDRPTRAHEFIFLLTRHHQYFYDSYAIREPAQAPHYQGSKSWLVQDHTPISKKKAKVAPLRGAHGTSGNDGNGMRYDAVYCNPAGRNKRSVWTVATQPFPEGHFATFPERLIEPCVLAGTSAQGACPACGAPWRRLVERIRTLDGEPVTDLGSRRGQDISEPSTAQGVGHWRIGAERQETGWEPGCTCTTAAAVPCVVLDPFAGSGTVGRVATKHGREAVLIELNPDYCAMIDRRTAGVQMSLESVV